ncbi:MAG: COG4223 family protein [Pseudomonadota bacterium]
MSSEKENLPARVEAIDADAKPVAALGAAPLIIGVVFMVALATVGVYLAKNYLRKEQSAATEVASPETAAPATILAIPTEEPATHTREAPAPEKIFNNANDALKAGADAIRGATPVAPDGAITELPTPPASVGNEAIQKAAKDAAKLLAPKTDKPATIDLSAPEPEAALESLERAAAADAASGDFVAPPVVAAIDNARLADEVAGLKKALQSDVGGLIAQLEAERQRTDEQKQEIERLNAEVERMRTSGLPAVRRARAALALSALSQKALLGGAFRNELNAYKSLEPEAPVLAALDLYADEGLATVASLKSRFPELRDAALAHARLDNAKGPFARIGANIASLVNLRPAAPLAGASAAAVLSRAEAKVAADDLAGALAELRGLAGDARTVFAPWMLDAKARLGAEAALTAAQLASPDQELAR